MRQARKSEGLTNSMGDKVKKIYIDSRFRSSGTPTDFQVNLIDDIECSDNQVVDVNAV